MCKEKLDEIVKLWLDYEETNLSLKCNRRSEKYRKPWMLLLSKYSITMLMQALTKMYTKWTCDWIEIEKIEWIDLKI